MPAVYLQVTQNNCLQERPQNLQPQAEPSPACEIKYIRLQEDIVQVKPAKQGIVPTLKSTGAGAVAGMMAGTAVSVLPMLASTENMRGMYVIAGAAAGMIGGALAGGMHSGSLDAKASAASAALIGSVLGGTIGLFSGGVKGALVGGVMAASIGASGAFVGSGIHD